MNGESLPCLILGAGEGRVGNRFLGGAQACHPSHMFERQGELSAADARLNRQRHNLPRRRCRREGRPPACRPQWYCPRRGSFARGIRGDCVHQPQRHLLITASCDIFLAAFLVAGLAHVSFFAVAQGVTPMGKGSLAACGFGIKAILALRQKLAPSLSRVENAGDDMVGV